MQRNFGLNYEKRKLWVGLEWTTEFKEPHIVHR